MVRFGQRALLQPRGALLLLLPYAAEMMPKDRVGYSDTLALHIHSVLNLFEAAAAGAVCFLFMSCLRIYSLSFVCDAELQIDNIYIGGSKGNERQYVVCTQMKKMTLLVLVCYC